jgi:hypothetical protein
VNEKIENLSKTIVKVKRIPRKMTQIILNQHTRATNRLVKYNQFWRLIIFMIYVIYIPQFVLMSFQSIIIPADSTVNLISKFGLGVAAVINLSSVILFALSAKMVETQVS